MITQALKEELGELLTLAGLPMAGAAAGAPAAGKPAGARIKFAMFFGGLETYVPMIAIADLPLSCKPAPNLWPAAAAIHAAPLQAFDHFLPRIPAITRRVVDVRESVLLHLHARRMLVAVALPLADCAKGGQPSLSPYSFRPSATSCGSTASKPEARAEADNATASHIRAVH